MSVHESLLPCALVAGREAADRVLSRLANEGIEGTVMSVGRRYHGIDGEELEIRVPASQVARARVLLS